MRDNCTRLQIAPVLSCSRAKSAPGCSIHLNPSEQLQKLPPAVTPITMSTCTTFICSFFSFWKKVACLSTNVFSILSIFVFFQLQIHLYNNQQLCWHCAPPFLSFYAFPPFSFQCCCFFRSLERPLESVCYRAQSVKVPSCKVCEVCSVCMYVNLYLCLYMCIFVCVYVCIRVCLCLCMFIYVYCKCLMCEGPQL